MHARMRSTALFTALTMAFAVALGGPALAQSVGTWRLNLAKSKFQEGQAPKSMAVVYEAADPGIKVTVDTVPADGPATHYSYTAAYDGKDVPVVGNPNADMAARTRVDANTTQLVNKKGGKVMTTVTIVTSTDGKTLTITNQGTDAMGHNVDSVAVYEKQ